MSNDELHLVAQSVMRRAQRQGAVLQREIRDELAQAGLSEDLWPKIIGLTKSSLRFRQGRYHFVTAVSQRLREEQLQQKAIQAAIRQLIRQHRRSTAQTDRRQQGRIDFIQPVKVKTEDDRELSLLSRDLSINGIRLIGTRSLLGQKVRVLIPRPDHDQPWSFVVRVLWTCTVGDALFENGGSFLDVG